MQRHVAQLTEEERTRGGTSMSTARILVVDDSRLAQKMIRDHLEKAGYAVVTASSGEEALAWLQREVPDLVISDVVMPGIDGYELCRRMRKQPRLASIPVILLTARGGISEKVAGFEAGADDYLVKPFDPVELELRVKVLLARTRAAAASEEKPRGKVISVFSLRGGAGVSTIAINLAYALAKAHQRPVALADLALESGHAGLMLDLRPRLTWADLAQQEVDAVDAEMIQRALARHESGIHLLAAPPSPALAELVNSRAVSVILSLLAEQYAYVVVDTASTMDEVTLAALDLSDIILLVLTPELASLKVASISLEIFESLGYPAGRTRLVVNWTFPQGGLGQKHIESALHKSVQIVIPYEKVAVVQAINRGIPLLRLAPGSPAAEAIAELARQIAPVLAEASPPQPSGRPRLGPLGRRS
ncbi:MAG: response regulator [Anaerolineae bacterium]|nr:response regulator [Anaerolineae bacterium]